MSNPKAQMETEFIILFTTLFLILLVVLGLQTGTLQSLSHEQKVGQAEEALRTIAATVIKAYTKGVGSIEQVTVTLPRGITAAIVTNTSMSYNIANDTVSIASTVLLNGTLPANPGTFVVTIEAREGYAQIS